MADTHLCQTVERVDALDRGAIDDGVVRHGRAIVDCADPRRHVRAQWTADSLR